MMAGVVAGGRPLLLAGGLPNAGLIAWWTFDNLSGSTLVDQQGSYNCTLVGSVPQLAGRFSNAMKNALGARNYYYAGASLFTAIKNAGTISVWVKREVGKAALVFNVRASVGASRQQFNIQADGTVTIKEYQGTDSISTEALPADEFVHVCFTWSASGRKIYINGALATITNSAAVFVYNAEGACALFDHWFYIDANTSIGSQTALDQMRVYNRQLTAAEVAALYAE